MRGGRRPPCLGSLPTVNLLDPLRTVIAVSAARLDLVEKARGRADAILLDLEGGAADAHRAALEALPDLVHGLRQADQTVLVRLTPGIEATNELRQFADLPVQAFVLPRAEDAQAIQSLASIIRAARGQSEAGIVPLIQTARGVVRAADLGACDMRVMALAFDADAVADDLMIDPEPLGLTGPGQQVVLGARAAGRMAMGITGTVARFENAERFRASCIHARAIGFSGVICSHLTQVPIANGVFRSSESEIAWADAVNESLSLRTSGSVPRDRDGRVIDRALIDRARLFTLRSRP